MTGDFLDDYRFVRVGWKGLAELMSGMVMGIILTADER